MSKKTIINLISILIPISLISVGFSSFSICEINSEKINLDASFADVIDLSDAIYFKQELNDLVYCENGFLYNGAISYKGYLIVSFELDVTKMKLISPFLLDDDSLILNISLKEVSTVNIISNFMSTSSLSADIITNIGGFVSFSIDNSIEPYLYSTKLLINSIDENVEKLVTTLIYCIDTSNSIVTNFLTDIYPIIKNQPITFDLTITVIE